MTSLIRTRAELAAARATATGRVGLVPTMGALHDGHAALIHAARAGCESVVVSIFVNPAQFGDIDDLERYPRTLEADVELCIGAGVDLVWAPDVDDVYPDGPARVHVAPGPLGAQLEGVSRPNHFAGMLTVVHKLFGIVTPHAAYFGEKDYQQLCLVRRMVADLDIGVEVVGVPTVREPDGLALSSRNRHLAAAERPAALLLSAALFAGAAAGGAGSPAVLAAARAVLETDPALLVDYLEVRDGDLGLDPGYGPARLLVAARVGTTRLIDNVGVAL